MTPYATLYQRCLWPLYEATRGRQACRLYRRALKAQWESRVSLLAAQLEALRTLVGHADRESPWHHNRLVTAGLAPERIRSLADLQRLPPMTKMDIREHWEDMLAASLRNRIFSHRTGGSTGVPLQFYMTRESYEWRLAISMRGYSWAGCEDGEKACYIWGEPIGTPPFAERLKTRLHNAVLRRRFFSSFRFKKESIARCIAGLTAFRPRTVVGYTNALVLLAQHLKQTGQTIPAPRGIITAAEGVSTQQRQLIETAFRAPVFASYGSREFMLIGMECDRHHGLHMSVDNLVVEVARPDGAPAEEGEIGELLITDLHNFGMPFLRYKIGDLGVSTNRQCPCGRGLPLLQRVEGRVLDAIRTPDGRIVPGEFFPHLMKEFDAVRQFQVLQKSLDLLQVKLVLGDGDVQPQLDRIRHEVRSILGPDIHVEFERVDEIPLAASGKFRVTLSELAPDH